MSIHDRPSLDAMLAPGRKTHEFHRAITLEIHRLNDREDALTELAATSKKRLVRDLAAEQAERIAKRRDMLLRGRVRGKK